MRWTKYVDPDEVKKAIEVLQERDSVFEVRIIGTAKKDIMSGYFKDADTLLKDFDNVNLQKKNIYITLGKVKEECFARNQSEQFILTTQTTSDSEIIRYRWLFVDLDPVRPTGISSSDAELLEAGALAEKVYDYLQGLGFEEPVRAMSGNGYHFLYRIDLPANNEGNAMVERCLKVLASLFDNDKVKIDTTNSNPSRICKLHGTLAQKGRSTKERPHRMSKILSVPETVRITDVEILRKLANELPEENVTPKPKRMLSQSQEFDLKQFMFAHGMTYSEDSNDRAKIYKLDECPFDASHKDGDAKIFQYSDGAIAFKCHHNSCRQYKWQDVRLKFEPNAYDVKDNHEDDERIDAGYKRHAELREIELASGTVKPKQDKKPKRKIRKLKKAAELLKKDLPEPRVFIGVGEELPILLEGTCILSAKPKLGKSWFALGMCLAVANGDDFLGMKTTKCSTLYLDLETSEVLQQRRLRKMLKSNGIEVPPTFYIDDETNKLEDGFVEQIEAYLKEDPDIGVVVIDVFQMIRTATKGSNRENEYEHAYRDITPLNELAQKHHIAIILVCHDRKAVDPDDPFSNILGSTGLQGAATQMIVMFRPRKDEPIHVSIKGKTIDGLPEMDVALDDTKWMIVEGGNSMEQEEARMKKQYFDSNIRRAVLAVVNVNKSWKGRCGTLINDAVQLGIAVTESPKFIGGFLHKHQARFLAEDNVQIEIVKNGTGGSYYYIHKFTVDTVDEMTQLTVDGFEKAD